MTAGDAGERTGGTEPRGHDALPRCAHCGSVLVRPRGMHHWVCTLDGNATGGE